ncbi:unnamed protein product [Linum tenue]|uniref:Zinc finger MYM-type protein 1-like n=1 Tax=Linum tenue TaxID=586396 RepID=A0AAV0KJ35_9ROSI|nr:unnamed protein product [Linum tenue]
MRDALLNQKQHIGKVIGKQSSAEVKKNRLRVKASIDSARWLALQGVAFRGHDETPHSKNRGNFIELIEIFSSYNQEVKSTVLGNAPKNAKYTSPDIQKQILHVLAKKVRNKIFEEIGDSKFSIIVDEACDESQHEQMAIILRFVDTQGLIQERFFDVVHVRDTTSMTLHTSICLTLASHKFVIQNLRGQGYDGASNMRGEWNGLKALFLKDHPQAYYVHCMAHRLQLALVSASKDVTAVHEFFIDLAFIVNAVNASSKRHDQLEVVEASRIAQLIAGEEIATGTGANQMSTLQRAGDTRWSSHLNSISSVIRLYESSYKVLEDIKKDGYTAKNKGDARVALRKMSSFEFIFTLLLLNDIFGTTDTLCRALQHKSQDIVNAMSLVEVTKMVLKEMRDEGWDSFLAKVIKFCNDYGITIPDFSVAHFEGRPCRQVDTITNEHHYHFDIFNAAIDVQIEELRSRFEEKVVELLKLSSSLDPTNGYKAFDIDAICSLARKYYPLDFSEKEIDRLAFQLKIFHGTARTHPALENLSSVAELCHGLAESGKAKDFDLVDRLIRLVLTLPVSTASGERAFSAMKLVKTKLRNKMSDDFLADGLIIYIERDIVDTFSLDDILSDFIDLKERRVRLR